MLFDHNYRDNTTTLKADLTKYIARRSIAAVLTLFALSVIVFLLINARGWFCPLRIPVADSPYLAKDREGNLTLLVHNENIDIYTVDIQIWIDDSLVVSECFDASDNPLSWRKYNLNLAEGEHEIRILSKRGSTTYIGSFHITNEHWAIVHYWSAEYLPEKFSFRISNEPIYLE